MFVSLANSVRQASGVKSRVKAKPKAHAWIVLWPVTPPPISPGAKRERGLKMAPFMWPFQRKGGLLKEGLLEGSTWRDYLRLMGLLEIHPPCVRPGVSFVWGSKRCKQCCRVVLQAFSVTQSLKLTFRFAYVAQILLYWLQLMSVLWFGKLSLKLLVGSFWSPCPSCWCVQYCSREGVLWVCYKSVWMFCNTIPLL